jgi:hypothetical protein
MRYESVPNSEVIRLAEAAADVAEDYHLDLARDVGRD